jgi:hypothetical protein
MKNTLKQLKATLQADRFIITGSFVMAEYGLTDYSQVKDLDIILVNPKLSVFEITENLMKVSPAPTTKQFLEIRDKNNPPIPAEKAPASQKKNYDDDEDDFDDIHKPMAKKKFAECVQKKTPSTLKPVAIFIYNNHKVDIYVEEHFTEPTLNVDGLEYSTIQRIISAKKTINRMKDWLQLRDMARMFFKQEEFDSILNYKDSWKKSLREEY